MKIYELNDLIATVCPIIGINSDGKIWFSPKATEEEKAAAKKVMEENIASLESSFP